jgi:hypothetical protein
MLKAGSKALSQFSEQAVTGSIKPMLQHRRLQARGPFDHTVTGKQIELWPSSAFREKM